MRHWLFGLSVVCASAAFTTSSRADPKAAGAAFDAGREALGRGELDNACALFRESFRLEPSPGPLLNLGECEERRGRVASAWQAFHDATLRLSRGDFRLAYAEQRAAALATRVPRVRLTLKGSASSSAVSLDGVELGAPSLGVAIPLDPGAHSVVVHAAGRRDARTSFELADAEQRDLTLAPSTVLAEPEPAPVRQKRRDVTLPLSLLGMSAVGFGTGAATGVLAMNANSVHREHCDAAGCDQEGIDAAHRGQPFAIVSTVSFSVGVAALGLGLYLLLTRPGP